MNNGKISFGFEFEGLVSGRAEDRYTHKEGWDYQADPTVHFEVCSPPYEDLQEAWEDILAQWKHWCLHNPVAIPILAPHRDKCHVGGHIHIGLGKSGRIRTNDEYLAIVRKLFPYLPYTYLVNAACGDDNVYSVRMGLRPYCNWCNTLEDTCNGRNELYWNDGTVELRMYDANMPAVQLTVAYLLTIALQHGREYPQKEAEALHSLSRMVVGKSVEATAKARYVWWDVASASLPTVEALKEVLVCSFVFMLNPYEVIKPRRKDWLKACTEGAFLSLRKTSFVRRIRGEVWGRKAMEDILKEIIVTDTLYALMLRQGVEVGKLEELTKAEVVLEADERKVRERLEKDVYILRLYQLSPTQQEELVRRVGVGWKELVDMRERWYIAVDGMGCLLGALKTFWSERMVVGLYVWDGRAVKPLITFIRANDLQGSAVTELEKLLRMGERGEEEMVYEERMQAGEG